MKKVKFFEHNNNIFLPTNSHKNQTKKGSKSNYVFRCSRCHFRFRPDDRPDAGWQRPRPSPTRGWCSRCNHELNIFPPSIKLFSSPGHGTTACLTVGRTNHMNRSKNTQGSRALDSLEFSWLNWSLWKRRNEQKFGRIITNLCLNEHAPRVFSGKITLPRVRVNLVP